MRLAVHAGTCRNRRRLPTNADPTVFQLGGVGPQHTRRVMVCNSTSCLAAGGAAVRAALAATTDGAGLGHDVQVVPTGCMGLCSRGPLLRVDVRGGESPFTAT